MAQASAFALRMPPEFKAAAKALTRVGFDEPVEGEPGYFYSIFPGSINEAICYLMKTGLKGTLIHIDKAISERSKKLAAYQEMMGWFLANPVASEILAHNLPEGSEGSAWLKIVEAEAEENSDIEPNATRGFTRREAAHELSVEQDWVFRLTEAKGAIQKALIVRYDAVSRGL